MAPKKAVSKPSQKPVPRPSKSLTEKEIPRKARTPAKRAREEPSTSTGRRVRFQEGTPSNTAGREEQAQTSQSTHSGASRRGAVAGKTQVLKMPTTYFRTEINHGRFYKNFYERKVFIPKIIDFKFLKDYGSDIEDLLDFQGWTKLQKEDDRVYPDLTRIFYYEWDEENFGTYVKEVEMDFGIGLNPSQTRAMSHLGQILGVPYVEEPFPEDLTMDQIYNQLTRSNKYHPGIKFLRYMDLSPRLRVLRLLIAHCIYPKGGGRNQLNPQEAGILWKVANKVKVSLPRLFLEALASRKDNPRGVLPYGTWITKILEHFEVDIEGEPFEVLKSTNAINKALIQRMKINVLELRPDAPEEEHQEDQAQAEGEQPPEAPAAPEEPPSPQSHGSYSPQGSVARERVPPTASEEVTLRDLKDEIIAMRAEMGYQENRMTSLVTGVLNAIEDMHSRQDRIEREMRKIRYHLASGHHKKRPMPELDPYESGSVHREATPDHASLVYSSAHHCPIKPIPYPISQFQFIKSLFLLD